MPENFESQNQEENLPDQRDEQISEQVKKVINEMRSVKDLDVPRDLRNALSKKFKSIEALTKMPSGDLYEELKASRAFTDDSVKQIKDALAKVNLSLAEKEGVKPEDEKDILTKRIESVNFFKTQYNVSTGALIGRGVHTLGDLINMSADELLDVKSFGPGKVDIVRKKLAEFWLKLKDE